VSDKPWWALDAFDVIWITVSVLLVFWLLGVPHGLLDWAINFVGLFAGWFTWGWVSHWWKTRR
jgi:hypothetical protein